MIPAGYAAARRPRHGARDARRAGGRRPHPAKCTFCTMHILYIDQISMTKISSTDLRPRLAEALRSAEGGDPVVITRHGRPAAALIAADQLELLERAAAGERAAGDRTPGDADADASRRGPAPEELLERAAAPSLRRIELDLERVPEKLRPVLGIIRQNLFQPRLTVGQIKRALGVRANDLTTRFRAATGATIGRYLEDRRLECACRLLVDTRLDVETVALLVGYRDKETFARALRRRYGVRPPVYREYRGKLSREAAAAARPGRAPAPPRHLAGMAAAPGAPCGRCGGPLEPDAALRVFEDLAPICGPCARERAPELVARLEAPGTA